MVGMWRHFASHVGEVSDFSELYSYFLQPPSASEESLLDTIFAYLHREKTIYEISETLKDALVCLRYAFTELVHRQRLYQ